MIASGNGLIVTLDVIDFVHPLASTTVNESGYVPVEPYVTTGFATVADPGLPPENDQL